MIQVFDSQSCGGVGVLEKLLRQRPERVALLDGVGLRAGRPRSGIGRFVRRPVLAHEMKLTRRMRRGLRGRAERRDGGQKQENGNHHPTHTDYFPSQGCRVGENVIPSRRLRSSFGRKELRAAGFGVRSRLGATWRRGLERTPPASRLPQRQHRIVPRRGAVLVVELL